MFFTDIRIYFFITLISLMVFFRFNLFATLDFLERKTQNKKIFFFFLLVLLIYFFCLKLNSQLAFTHSGIDFSHFDYALWNASQTGRLDVSIQDNTYYLNLLGNHFAPFLYLLVPFYWIKSSHLWLPFFQVLAIGLSFWSAWTLARVVFPVKRLFKKTLLLFLSLGFIFNEMTLSVFRYEFHHEIFYLPILLWLSKEIYCFFIEDRKNLFALFSALTLALSIKEDAPLVLSGIFLYFSILGPCLKKRMTSLLYHF